MAPEAGMYREPRPQASGYSTPETQTRQRSGMEPGVALAEDVGKVVGFQEGEFW